tara:strand:+ start:473 stop:718 length:246 start_codon:yes stop_codon:yes gene_type:complete
MILENGDLVMFRKPGFNMYRFDAIGVEELYVYGMIKKYTAPYRSFNKSCKKKYDILSSTGKVFYDIREDKIIILSKGKNDR